MSYFSDFFLNFLVVIVIILIFIVDNNISLDVGSLELVVDRTGVVALVKAFSEVVITCVNFIENSPLGRYLKSKVIEGIRITFFIELHFYF
jgi:hypothetical protein